jgi:hypothetical protein
VSWLNVIGWGGSALVVFSLLQTRILRLRTLNLIGSLVLLGFNIALGIWPMVGLNAVLALINVLQLRRLVADRHDDRAYAVLEVGSTDAYLRHVLSLHATDVAQFNPDFHPDQPAELAFLVQRGDSTAGVVLAHDAGGGLAQIDLDYVLPEYRDFTPGEFVYRRSAVFTSRGFDHVQAPPNVRQADSYLARVGFHQQGNALILDLPTSAQG